MNADIIDYSIYGNQDDAFSNTKIAAALRSLNCEVRILQMDEIRPGLRISDNVWMRYDARTMGDLRKVLDFTARLEKDGRSVFPSSSAIMNSEDKWLTYLALTAAGIPAVATFSVSQIINCGRKALIKPRPGWGGMGQHLVENSLSFRSFAEFPDDSFICQPFVEHTRTLTVLAADGLPVISIEKKPGPKEFRTDEYHGGTARRCSLPPDFANFAVAALEAVSLSAGSVDLLEHQGRIEVLEVNSAPGLFYTEIQDFDFAIPLARSAIGRFR